MWHEGPCWYWAARWFHGVWLSDNISLQIVVQRRACLADKERSAMMHSGKSDSPFKTVIQSGNMGFHGPAPHGPGPVLPPTAGPSGPFATHNSNFGSTGPCENQSFRTVIDEGAPGPAMSSMGPMGSMNSRGMPQAPQNPMMSSQVPAAFRSQNAGFAPPPLQTMVPGGPMMSGAGAGVNEIGLHCSVIISKLLDVPVESSMFAKEAKTYQLRVLDHKNKELARSEEIQGLDDTQLKGLTTQTFAIPEELGTLRSKTLSKTIQIQAGY